MKKDPTTPDYVELKEDVSQSPLYSEDLAPVPPAKRTWNTWHLAFVWVGMAVCIPTYMLASGMMRNGISWWGALLVIGLANIVITVPMVLNGHAGVKYGIPFPVLGRAAFGVNGIHVPALLRGLVACGWFGIQTWLGGLSCYAIWNAITGMTDPPGLNAGEFIAFGVFWLINMYFVWAGTESIKWLEEFSAPILIVMGIALIIWGSVTAGGFGTVLEQGKQLERPTITWVDDRTVELHPLLTVEGQPKAHSYLLQCGPEDPGTLGAIPQGTENVRIEGGDMLLKCENVTGHKATITLIGKADDGSEIRSNPVALNPDDLTPGQYSGMMWTYILAFTAMVGFWATMSLSIADITRFTKTQRAQVRGQFIGLPGTMILYSFVGIFVTCAALVSFDDVLAADDAPWDPVALLSRFKSPVVVVISQIMMIIATLSTNIAANVIAPANAISNLNPKRISFKAGATITGILGILLCPWWIMPQVANALIFVSGLLGPVLGVMIADYFVVRRKHLQLAELFKQHGAYSYSNGVNMAAVLAMVLGITTALVGYFIPSLEFLYKLSWVSGFAVAFIVYIIGMRGKGAVVESGRA
ncbi:MAG: NCS1 family nucleobase:cation symporter-1 [Bacteroidia bacterium]